MNQLSNHYNNSLVEIGYSTLETELQSREDCFANLEEARLELVSYLDYYYNTQHPPWLLCTLPQIERQL